MCFVHKVLIFSFLIFIVLSSGATSKKNQKDREDNFNLTKQEEAKLETLIEVRSNKMKKQNPQFYFLFSFNF